MGGILGLILLVALAVGSVASMEWEGFKATGRDFERSSPNSLSSFQSGCPACEAPYSNCMWCANSGYGCFLPEPSSSSCCGCVNGACYVCPASSSCAIWNTYDPGFCPPPSSNNNSTRYGKCIWHARPSLAFQGQSVLRCHSTSINDNVLINWRIRPDGPFAASSVWVLDQKNFDLYISGQPDFSCLNQNCTASNTDKKEGQMTHFGSIGYYIIITNTEQTWTGFSTYFIDAFIH